MFIDPVCEREVEADSAAARLEYGDEVYFFCSAACRDRFLMEPERWLYEEEDEEETAEAE